MIRRAFYFIVLFIICYSVNSCERGIASFTLAGTITDETFQQGLTGAEVKLFKVPIGTNSMIAIDSVILTADGKYEFTFPRDKTEKFIIKISKENYFEISDEIPFSSLTPSSTTTRNYGTKAKSWVEMRFVNSTVLPNETFRFMKTSENTTCEECCPGGLIDLVEQTYYSRTCLNNANSLFSVDYWIINGGTSQYGHKEVTPAPFDTALVLVNY
jgi:hypothetical protein